MLAQPRKKVRIGNDPNNLKWAKDSDNVGKSMMCKLGWDSKSSLGVNNEGMKKHISVKIKNDSAGIGAKDAETEYWADAQDGFNDLLKNLAANYESGVDQSHLERKDAVEDQIDNSKRRLYKRFSKSKDVLTYSEADKAMIMGERQATINTKRAILMDQQSSANSSLGSTEGESQLQKSADVSMEDYFQQLSAKRRMLAGLSANPDPIPPKKTKRSKSEDKIVTKKGKKEKKHKKNKRD